MGILEWATSPWGQHVPIHIAWVLIWVCLFAGIGFMVVHALYIGFFGKPKLFVRNDSADVLATVPEKVPRHGFVARMFHWVMAGSMFVLLFSAFLPKVGFKFNWVIWHWVAGTVFTASVIFHIIHASFFLDFWSIWPDRIDVRDTMRRVTRFFGKPTPLPDRFAKYPLENKMYHFVIMVTGLAAILTGGFMMKRVTTVFFTRNPYIFSDMTWGLMYVLHGLVGVSLIALVLVHVYFGIRPEKREITRSMILGWMGRDFYLEEHDPLRWNPKLDPEPPAGYTGSETTND